MTDHLIDWLGLFYQTFLDESIKLIFFQFCVLFQCQSHSCLQSPLYRVQAGSHYPLQMDFQATGSQIRVNGQAFRKGLLDTFNLIVVSLCFIVLLCSFKLPYPSCNFGPSNNLTTKGTQVFVKHNHFSITVNTGIVLFVCLIYGHD